MTNDLIYNEMIRAGADGVDFVPIWIGFPELPPILASYTKEQWLSVDYYPRSNRVYWKFDGDGNKVYLDDRYNPKTINEKKAIKIERDVLITLVSLPKDLKKKMKGLKGELLWIWSFPGSILAVTQRITMMYVLLSLARSDS